MVPIAVNFDQLLLDIDQENNDNNNDKINNINNDNNNNNNTNTQLRKALSECDTLFWCLGTTIKSAGSAVGKLR